MMRGKLYLSSPALVTACGRGTGPLLEHLFAADNSAIKPVRASFGGKEFYAATVDDGLLHSVSGQDSTHIMRLANAALADLEAPIKQAISLYGESRIGTCVGGCDNGSELSIQAHKNYAKNGRFPDGYRLDMQSAWGMASYVKDEE